MTPERFFEIKAYHPEISDLIQEFEELCKWCVGANEWIMNTTQWIEQDVIPLSAKTIERLTEMKDEIKRLQNELASKNWMLEKALIDVAVLKEEYQKSLKQIEKLEVNETT